MFYKVHSGSRYSSFTPFLPRRVLLLSLLPLPRWHRDIVMSTGEAVTGRVSLSPQQELLTPSLCRHACIAEPPPKNSAGKEPSKLTDQSAWKVKLILLKENVLFAAKWHSSKSYYLYYIYWPISFYKQQHTSHQIKAVTWLPWRYQDVTGKLQAICGSADCLRWCNRLHSILVLFQNETKQYKCILKEILYRICSTNRT